MAVCQRKDGRWLVTYRDGEHVRSKSFPPSREGKRQAKAFAAEIAKRKALRKTLSMRNPRWSTCKTSCSPGSRRRR
ncbi:MAG: hypothetical protein KKF77_00025 [Proteobacteria bacterium]|nr:hypothetical protein [Pseudomonadota bacterium]